MTTSSAAFYLFAPPYRELLPFDPGEGFLSRFEALCGVALIWNMQRGHGEGELEFAAQRPGGVPLLIVLPEANLVRRLRIRILEAIEEARPHSILPFHPRLDPEELAMLLRREPEGLADELLDYLIWRGVQPDQETRRIIRRMMEVAENVRTLSGLSRSVYLSRRAIGRRFRDRGLPVPSHWLQFCRLLHASIQLQNSDASLHDVSRSLGYPDGFTLSNQMDRVVGVRPSMVRERLGWEWVVESWLRTEYSEGGLAIPLRGLEEVKGKQERKSNRNAAVSPARSSDPQGNLELAELPTYSGAERGGAAA